MERKDTKPVGRPPIYGKRTNLLIAMPVELVDRLDKWRESRGLSRAAAVAKAVEKMVGRK